LISKLIDQSVLNARKGAREAAGKSVIKFLIQYPLGDKRFANHVKQLLQNALTFEHDDGRLSALGKYNFVIYYNYLYY
jgi:hypothetical protein